MIKTAIFIAGVACGCALGSAMTDEQRQQLSRRLGRPVQRVTDSQAAQRLGDSVRHVADNATERAAGKLDELAEAIEPNHNGANEQDTANASSTSTP
jgi:hypothetical protein